MPATPRFHALDAVRAFALLLGVVFHATMSFIPGMPVGVWAINDSSPSSTIGILVFVSHIFRMSLFFFLAGFFAHMMFHRKGVRGFWADRAKRIAAPLVVGWLILFPAIGAVWIWGMIKTFGTLPPRPAELTGAATFGALPLFHLWFLYFLLLMYAVIIAVRSVVARFDPGGRLRGAVDRLVGGAVRRGVAALVLGLPLCAALYLRPDWQMWFGIPVPDKSLVPILAAFVGYGTAFAFGWLANRQTDLLHVWRRQWPAHVAAALAATAACLAIAGITPTFTAAAPGLPKLAFALAYCLAIWCWVFGLTGVAMRFLFAESAVRRYVADSSYWIYLAHLPIVAAFQVAVGRLPWHWTVKFPIVLAASFTVLFLSYHFLVRYTFVGAVLNGRKPRPLRAGGEGAPPTARRAAPSVQPVFAEDVQ
jgi:peptidoglycan/LPS O-acetylase OafA/YrhL